MLATALARACAAIENLTGLQVVAGRPQIGIDAEPALQPALLRLALLSQGRGAIVVCAGKDAVTALAAGAVSAPLQAAESPGDVVLTAAEVLLRHALAAFNAALPGAQAPQRVVRLAEGALPARVAHYTLAGGISIDGRVAMLQWLLPASLLSQTVSTQQEWAPALDANAKQ